MGAQKGTLTYTRYFVLDEPDAGFREAFMEALQSRAFREIDVEAGKKESFGWVSQGDLFETDLRWDRVFVDPYVCVSLRHDAIKIPPSALRAHYERRVRAYCQEVGREVLKRSEKANLKEEVEGQLRRRALADIKTYDVVWNTLDGTLRLWTHNRNIREVVEELIQETWGLRLVPMSPYTAVAARAEEPETPNALLDIEPASFVAI